MADDELKTGTGTSKDPKRLHEPARERAKPFSWEGEGAGVLLLGSSGFFWRSFWRSSGVG